MIKPCSRGSDSRIQVNRSFAYSDDLRERIRSHYSAYYERFGIRNVATHVEGRLREEEIECGRLLRHESLLSRRFDGGRSLIVGLGSGGLAICLEALGNEVHGVEPDKDALGIAWKRMDQVGGQKSRLVPGVAEFLPYSSDVFDHVFCYTVLEHVRDVEASLREMIRVLKPGGVVMLHTPDYRFPFEDHYKVPVLLKPFPRFVSAAMLKLAGKPIGPLYREITYVTAKQVQHLLMSIPNLSFFRVFESYPADWAPNRKHTSWKSRISFASFRFWARYLAIYRYQEYYIFKRQ